MSELTKETLERLEQAANSLSIVGVASGELLSLIAAARELEAVKRDAGRMHYLGNLVRTKEQLEWDELKALMRKYPPVTEPTNGR